MRRVLVLVILTCVRHGETAWNSSGRFQGHTDVPLDAKGRAQAQTAALRLRDAALDAAVASDLSRAAETARIIAAGHGLEVRLDPAWREMRFGAWEGKTWPEIEALDPVAAAEHRPPGGESFEQMCDRVQAAVRGLVQTYAADASVLLVAHAGTIHALLRVLGIDAGGALRVRLAPASISRFALREGRWACLALNTVEGPIAGGLPEFAAQADKAPG